MIADKRKTAMQSANPAKKRLITDFFSKQSTAKGVEKVETESIRATETSDAVEVETKTIITEAQDTLSSTTEEEKQEKEQTDEGDDNYHAFCSKYNFNKAKWIASLTEEQNTLLDLEIRTLHITWLAALHKTLTQPYFLQLKKFVLAEQAKKTIFPPNDQIYSWSQYTPLPNITCLVLGQDPYHNFNQAHGLAFSVIEPTRPPPSLVNIYKTLQKDFPEFQIPDYSKLSKEGKPGGGNLTKWAKQGVLMLNTCLTVEAHKANSHANKGWETFTEEVLKAALQYHTQADKRGFVIMGWGTPAQKRIQKIGFNDAKNATKFLILRSVHPSPLSAHRGFFTSQVFQKCNEWLGENHGKKIDWAILEGNVAK